MHIQFGRHHPVEVTVLPREVLDPAFVELVIVGAIVERGVAVGGVEQTLIIGVMLRHAAPYLINIILISNA
jgi:hypothetical protein